MDKSIKFEIDEDFKADACMCSFGGYVIKNSVYCIECKNYKLNLHNGKWKGLLIKELNEALECNELKIDKECSIEVRSVCVQLNVIYVGKGGFFASNITDWADILDVYFEEKRLTIIVNFENLDTFKN